MHESEKGYDAGKQVSVVKRHSAVETHGLPHAIAVTDRKGAMPARGRCAADLQVVQRILADGGYVGRPFAQAVEEPLGAEVQIAKRSELTALPALPSCLSAG